MPPETAMTLVTPLPDRMTVDVVSDVVCPWCYVGKRRLEVALDSVDDLDVEVRWRPFQLDPTIPPEGKDRQEYFLEKFGDLSRVAAIHERLKELGDGVGIRFAFERITRSPNTLDAHRLIRWASIEGLGEAVVEKLFSLYFEDGADLGDHDVLVEAAVAAGLSGDLVRRLLDGDADREAVQEEIATAQRIGVTGVPCFIIDGRYAVMGAQEPEAIIAALRQARDEREGLGERD
jgi:predicted DsbA family dithiol-disulfide isomerase